MQFAQVKLVYTHSYNMFNYQQTIFPLDSYFMLYAYFLYLHHGYKFKDNVNSINNPRHLEFLHLGSVSTKQTLF